MADPIKIYQAEYSYYQDFGDFARTVKERYFIIAQNEQEATAKGDKLFGFISESHQALIGGTTVTYDNDCSASRSRLSNFRKSITEYSGIIISAPKLSGRDAYEFGLEAVIASSDDGENDDNDNNPLIVKFIPVKLI
ncbi:MAG: hypothetical protein AABW48_03955 [Nanoarchaeota archaeon]